MATWSCLHGPLPAQLEKLLNPIQSQQLPRQGSLPQRGCRHSLCATRATDEIVCSRSDCMRWDVFISGHCLRRSSFFLLAIAPWGNIQSCFTKCCNYHCCCYFYCYDFLFPFIFTVRIITVKLGITIYLLLLCYKTL